MDSGSRVLLGAGWVACVLAAAPELYVMLRDGGVLSPIASLNDGQTEAIYVVGLALLLPAILWMTGRG
jgi:hypothetical protein